MGKKKKEEKHVYHNAEGKIVPSVTTIIGILNKPEIVTWANMLGFKHIKHEEFLNVRAAIGTDFHKMVEDYTSGKEVSGEHYKESIEMFERFCTWAKCHYYKVLLHEQTLVCDSFGGTLDAVAEFEGHLSLVDYKTSAKIYPSQFVQLAGYAVLLKQLMPETYEKIEMFGIVSMRYPQSHKFISKKKMEKKFIPVFEKALQLYDSWDRILEDTYW